MYLPHEVPVMTRPELATNGTNVYVLSRPPAQQPPALPVRRELTQAQIDWCAAYLKGFAWPRFVPMQREQG
jgi:hypothetical protein